MKTNQVNVVYSKCQSIGSFWKKTSVTEPWGQKSEWKWRKKSHLKSPGKQHFLVLLIWELQTRHYKLEELIKANNFVSILISNSLQSVQLSCL